MLPTRSPHFAARYCQLNSRRVEISSQAYIIGAAMLLLLPLRSVIGFAFAAIFHEICHIIAIYAVRAKVLSVKIGSYGAQIETCPLSASQELLVSAAGPIGALLLLPLFRWAPFVSLGVLVQSLYNLLPVFPLDGGRMVNAVATLYLGQKNGERIAAIIGRIASVSLLVGGIWACFLKKWGILPLGIGICLCFRANGRKIPCKSCMKRLQ